MNTHSKIQTIFMNSFSNFDKSKLFPVQCKAALSIMNCKTGSLGYNASICDECGHIKLYANSCRNRNCPNCQAVNKEIWVDKRRSEVIDAPYYHVVFTVPHQLNPLFLSNQSMLYGLLHRCTSETLLELSADSKYLGVTPGIIQVLHTWNQELEYHVHMHCIISGGGLTKDLKLKTCSGGFFIPVHVLRDKFKGKFLSHLKKLYKKNSLHFSDSIKYLCDIQNWNAFIDTLYSTEWCSYIKETFNRNGNAIEYLGKYTNKIAISNRRIISVSETEVTFSARGIQKGEPRRTVTLKNEEFIRRFLLHVLPKGFQKIRCYGFLSNSKREERLRLIFQLQGHQTFKRMFIDMSKAEIIKAAFGYDICKCPNCGRSTMRILKKSFMCSSA